MTDRGVLYDTASDDDGHSFAPVQVLVDSANGGEGNPTNASLYVSPEGVVYASWVDRNGGYLASWQTAEDLN